MTTHTTAEISEQLKLYYGIDLSPMMLKKIQADGLFKVYGALLDALDYRPELITQDPNFEAQSQLVGSKEDYENVILLVNFGRILNSLLSSINFHCVMTHYDLHFPNWKHHRVLISVLLYYDEYVKDLKSIYEEVCTECIQQCGARNEFNEIIRDLKEKINDNKGQLAIKKNVENVQEVLDTKIKMLADFSLLKQQSQEKAAKLKEDQESALAKENQLQQELTDLEAEENVLSSALIENVDKQQNELKELEGKVANLKMVFNYKSVENAQFENKKVVNVDKNVSTTVANSLTIGFSKYSSLVEEVERLKNRKNEYEESKSRRLSVENNIKSETKNLCSVKEQKVAAQNTLRKNHLQMNSALKDRKIILGELLNQMLTVTERKKTDAEREQKHYRKQEELEQGIRNLEGQLAHDIEIHDKILKLLSEWKKQKLAEKSRLKDKLESTKKMFAKQILKKYGQ